MAPARGTGASRAARQAARRRGGMAEWLCRQWLRMTGHRILAAGYRTKVGEIDVVAARRGTVVFVEVKARPDEAGAAAAVGLHQRRRIARAAQWFLRAHPQYASHAWRFDVFAVAPWRLPVHIRNAWRPEG